MEKEERIQETFQKHVVLAPFPDAYEIQGEFGHLLTLHEIFFKVQNFTSPPSSIRP